MSTSTLNKRARWAVPIITALAVGAAVAFPAMSSADTPDLPEKSAEQLLTDIATAPPRPLSGTVVSTARLGLPDLSALQGLAGAKGMGPVSPANLLTGSTTIRMWSDPEQGVRASLLGPTTEYSAVATHEGAWTYSSDSNAATHFVFANAEGLGDPEDAAKAAGVPSPDTAADAILTQLDPTTSVGVDPTVTLAGRDCYQIVLTPKESGSLIASVRIAVDAETSTPLRLQIWSVSDSDLPSYELTFTDVTFDAPDASVFDFVPPAGATVKEEDIDVAQLSQQHEAAAADASSALAAGELPYVQSVGEGWAQIKIVSGVDGMFTSAAGAAQDLGAASGMLTNDPTTSLTGSTDPAAIMSQLGTAVPEGTLFSGTLFSVLLTTDGRLLIGAVPGSALQTAAG